MASQTSDLIGGIPPEVSVYEVSPRDGLQNEPLIVPLPDKLRLIAALVDAARLQGRQGDVAPAQAT